MSIENIARHKGITRLCHFTRANNLGHILVTGSLQGTAELSSSGSAFSKNDAQRFDGKLSHVCCSVEYPNSWYLDRIRTNEVNYLDWVILTLDLALLDQSGVLFYPFNAARGSGYGGMEGMSAFENMFSPEVIGKQRFVRQTSHPKWWPTDDQAEVQIPGPIPLSSVQTVIFPSEQAARREVARHAMLAPPNPLPPVMVGEVLFDKYLLSRSVRAGRRPPESPIP